MGKKRAAIRCTIRGWSCNSVSPCPQGTLVYLHPLNVVHARHEPAVDLQKRLRNFCSSSFSDGHRDHAGGNFQFDEPIYIHPDDMELYAQFTGEATWRGSVEIAGHAMDHVSGKPTDILPNGFDEEVYYSGGTGKHTPVQEGEVFSLGGITLRVMEVPGHTAGSLSLLSEEEHILFAGDAMSPFVWLFAPESKTLSDYIATLKKAKSLNIAHFVVGTIL